MLRLHMPDIPTQQRPAKAVLSAPVPGADTIRKAVWIDLFRPSAAEVAAVERAVGLRLPGPAVISEIEPSSRSYASEGALVMNLQLLTGLDEGTPSAIHVSLVLAPGRLITIRNDDSDAFRTFAGACEQHAPGPDSNRLLLRLLEEIVGHSADILERTGSEIDGLSERIFGFRETAPARLSPAELQEILRGIGRVQFILNKIYESLSTQTRATGFLIAAQSDDGKPHPLLAKAGPALQALSRDLGGLSANCSFLIENASFLLDAAVGRISIEQNAIMSVFSVAAVIFLPPTLIGTIYGMNFQRMPELALPYAYPLTLVAMLLSAVLPYLWFKKKGWL